jgi:hypothetical protein
MGTMHVMGPEGDVEVTWDPDDRESTDKAKAEYDRLKKEGYEFFEPVETKGKRITRWDKKLGKVIASPGVKKAADKATGKRAGAMSGGPNAAVRC